MIMYLIGGGVLVGWIPVMVLRTEYRVRRYIKQGVAPHVARRWAMNRG